MNWLTPAFGISEAQREYYARATSFVRRVVAPNATEFDRREEIPRELLVTLGEAGYLGVNVGPEYGGTAVDHVQIGLLHEAIGRACSSTRSIMTAHGMVCEALGKWGTLEQRSKWLPHLAAGRSIGAFALTEPDTGSDAKSITTSAVKTTTGYVLRGEKRWVTAGQVADLFLVFAKYEGRDVAFLVERDTPGLSLTPVKGMLGLRAAMLASVLLSDCEVPHGHQVGGLGFGIDAVGGRSLDFGRHTIAWGCLGIGNACLEASIRHTNERRQFGKRLREHQLVAGILSDMIVRVRGVGLICVHAARLRDLGDPRALWETCAAKYAASVVCARAASDAVQLHGAVGCGEQHPAQRYYRDAKIMEIIEGSNQIQQILIARLSHDDFRSNG